MFLDELNLLVVAIALGTENMLDHLFGTNKLVGIIHVRH